MWSVLAARCVRPTALQQMGIPFWVYHGSSERWSVESHGRSRDESFGGSLDVPFDGTLDESVGEPGGVCRPSFVPPCVGDSLTGLSMLPPLARQQSLQATTNRRSGFFVVCSC